MKIYVQEMAPLLMRVNIKKLGVKTEFITFCETTQDDVLILVKDIVEAQKLSPFIKGVVTNVEVRECRDSKNGKSKSISFKGIEPSELKKLILERLIETNKINITK